MRTRNKVQVQVIVYKEEQGNPGPSIDSAKILVVSNRDNSDVISLVTPKGETVLVIASELEDAVRRCQ